MYDKHILYIKNKIIFSHRKIRDVLTLICHFLTKKCKPNFIYIEPTNICNANCIFCAYQFYKAEKKTMPDDILNKIIDEIKLNKYRKINLTPLAGEIFTDRDIMDKIHKIGSLDLKIFSTYTNMIDADKFDTKKILNSGLTHINISTAPMEENLFRKIYRSPKYGNVVKNIAHLLEEFKKSKEKTVKEIRLEFRSNIPLEECKKKKDFKRFIEKFITKSIKVSALRNFDSWMGLIKEEDLLDGMKLATANGKKIIPCSRLSNVQILSNGDMRVCGCRFNNNSSQDIFYIGNINNISILDAYNSKKVIDLKMSFLLKRPPAECQKCSWYS